MPPGASNSARANTFVGPCRRLMEQQPLNRIAEWCGGGLLNAEPGLVAHGISIDSRALKPGDLFVAIAGDKFDGHDFLGDVCAKGAVAAIVEERRMAALPPGNP